jgi:uncharacterized protein
MSRIASNDAGDRIMPRDDDDDLRISRRKKKKRTSDNDKQMAMFCHLGGILGGFLVPLLIWMMKREESRYIDRHGKEALNFALTMMIVNMVGGLITCGLIFIITIPLGMIFHIQGAMAASRGESYEYPMSIRMIS